MKYTFFLSDTFFRKLYYFWDNQIEITPYVHFWSNNSNNSTEDHYYS